METNAQMKERVEMLPVMNNKRLNKFSQKYKDDSGETIEKRCFFLFAGTDLNTGSAFNLELTFSKHDDPNIQQTIELEILVDNLVFEGCSEVIVGISQIVPDFSILFRYDDLFNLPSSMDLSKRIRYQAPLFFMMKEHSRQRNRTVAKPPADKDIKAWIKELLGQKQ